MATSPRLMEKVANEANTFTFTFIHNSESESVCFPLGSNVRVVNSDRSEESALSKNSADSDKGRG